MSAVSINDESSQSGESSSFEDMAPNDMTNETFGKLPDLSFLRRSLITASLLVGLLLSVMDVTIVTTSIYTIALQFNSLANTVWIILAYALTEMGFAVILTRLSDFLGRRNTIVGSFVLFCGFSIGCGFAQTSAQIIMFRTFQGIGGAGLYAMAILVCIEISTEKALPFIAGYIGVTVALGGVLGPVLGGVINTYLGWRWIFWINAPASVIATTTLIVCWPRNDHGQWARRSAGEFDYIGCVLILAAPILVVVGLQEAGTGFTSWRDPIPICTITAGGLTWLLFLAWEYQLGKRKNKNFAAMMPKVVWTCRPYTAGVVLTIMTGFILYEVAFSVPLRLQIVNRDNSAQAGVGLLPLLGALALGCATGASLSFAKNVTFFTFLGGSAIQMIGCGLMSTLSANEPDVKHLFGYCVILGFGSGLTFSSITLLTSMEVPMEEHSVSQGLVAQARVFGGCVGVAASNAVFNHRSHVALVGILTPTQIDNIQLSTEVLLELNFEQLIAVQSVYAQSFADGSRLCLYIATASFVLSFLTWQNNKAGAMERAAERTAMMAEARQPGAGVRSIGSVGGDPEKDKDLDLDWYDIPLGRKCDVGHGGGCALCLADVVLASTRAKMKGRRMLPGGPRVEK